MDRDGEDPERHADPEQNARGPVLDGIATGPRPGQEGARNGAENREDSRRSARTETFTTVKALSSSSDAVPLSAGTPPTKVTRPSARSVVKKIAT
jgi:hypothetical protein